jgi:Alanyl-tRNA synthetase
MKEHEKYLAALRDIKAMRKELIKVNVTQWQKQVGADGFLFLELKDYGSDELKLICQEIEKQKPGVYFLLSHEEGNKVSFVGYISKASSHKLDLRVLSKELGACNLRGGGSAEFIQGGGVEVDGEAVKKCVIGWFAR